MSDAGYRPPWWLRSGHVQTMLGSSPWRRRRGAQALAATGAVTTAHLVDGGPGVRLEGLHSVVPGVEPRGFALLLHGWEGSAESSYMRQTAARLLQRTPGRHRLRTLASWLARAKAAPLPLRRAALKLYRASCYAEHLT